MVSDLLEHHAPDLAAQTFPIGAVEAFERPAVDRDLVRQDAAVTASPSRQRNALIEPKQRLAGRRLHFDDDRDIGDDVSKFAREGGHCVFYLPLEVDLTSLFIDVYGHGSSVAGSEQQTLGPRACTAPGEVRAIPHRAARRSRSREM